MIVLQPWSARLMHEAKFRAFARDAHEAALRDPAKAVSGYCLANESENWAEVFAAAELGITHPMADAARDLLKRVQ